MTSRSRCRVDSGISGSFLAALSISFIVLRLRINPSFSLKFFVDNCLAYEDGSIFLGAALSMGFKSLWQPYAGYLHFFPRMVALLTSYLPLGVAPRVFFVGWVVAYCLMLYVMVRRLSSLHFGIMGSILVSFLIAAQPSIGEPFFNLTNSQWFLAIALVLIVCIPCPRERTFSEFLLLLMLSLSGPFSVLLSPVIALRLAIFRDWQRFRHGYLAFSIGSALQLLTIVVNFSSTLPKQIDDTMTPLPSSTGGIGDWVGIIDRTVFFGGHGPSVVSLSIIFWLTFLYQLMFALVDEARGNIQTNRLNPRSVALMLLTAGIILGAGLFKGHNNLPAIGPLSRDARYFLVPYSIVAFLSVALANGHNVKRLLAPAILVPLFLLLWVKVERDNLHFQAYALLAEGGHRVSVPIGSGQPLILEPSSIGERWRQHSRLLSLGQHDFKITDTSECAQGTPISKTPICRHVTYVEDAFNRCRNARATDLEFSVHVYQSSKSSKVTVIWGATPWEGYERYFPAGITSMQFAFLTRYAKRPLRYKIVPDDTQATLDTTSLHLYCLE